MRRITVVMILIFQLSLLGCHEQQENRVEKRTVPKEQTVSANMEEYSWLLDVNEQEKKEAEDDCREIADSAAEIYRENEKGASVNAVITDETAEQALDVLADSGCPVFFSKSRRNMRNHKKMERFLEHSMQGEPGEILVYELCLDGGVWRNKFCFDGQEMRVLCTRSDWTSEGQPVIHETQCSRIEEWKYTEKGWFIYELSVPEPPQVSERVNGSCMIRVKPLKSRYRRIADQYLCPIGYQGNNLFCSDWDEKHLEELDYTGLFEYFYFMKYQEQCREGKYPEGIPMAEFETLMQEYLPVTAEQLRSAAAFEEETQTYQWNRLGCLNYTPTAFGTSTPEITKIEEKADSTTEITIDAVCQRNGSDCVMSHVLTVRFDDAGGVQYLGNRILGEGSEKIPAYEERIRNKS